MSAALKALMAILNNDGLMSRGPFVGIREQCVELLSGAGLADEPPGR